MDVDLFLNIWRAMDLDSAVGENLGNFKWALFVFELLVVLVYHNVDFINFVVIWKAFLVFARIVLDGLFYAHLVDELPVGGKSCIDDHVASKYNLSEGGAEDGTIGSANTPSNG